MSKYKRWILLLTALTVFVVHIESLKATSLIHAGKFSKLLNTTTSTTTEDTPTTDLNEGVEEPEEEEEKFRIVNGTKIPLTGIPQIDYVWDPNLPRELNGFNLSHYPFLDSMPAEEDIGFDCEEKINGFYASMKFGCQLYHHCLYGVRSDFICANFTAFDQKTFICHFASEVDCKNSYKYWNRNDDLYKATTEKATTAPAGLAPLFDRNLYKRPSPGSTNTGGLKNNAPPNPREPQAPLALPGLNSPPIAAPVVPLAPARTAADDLDALPVARPGNRPLRRPYRRRRPQIDYYYYDDDYEEEFYDERGRRRQQRPRNRRPVYDDYDSRRPYVERETRRPVSDDFDDYEYERRPYRSRNRSESRKNGEDRRKYEDRRFDDRRRPDDDDRKPIEGRKRLQDERRSYSDDRRSSDDRRQPLEDRKRNDEERSQADERKSHRRKNHEDTTDDKPRDRVSERSELTEKRQAVEDSEEEKPLLKTSIFDRPRPSPKIARPVPLSEKNKYSFKSAEKHEEQKKKDDEYYEEYDDAPTALLTTTSTTSTTVKPSTRTFATRTRPSTTLSTTKKPATSTIAAQEIEYYEDEDYDAIPVKIVETSTISKTKDDRSSFFNSRLRNSGNEYSTSTTTTTYSPPSAHDNFRLNRFKSPNEKEINKTAIRENAQKIFDETSLSTSSRKPLPSVNSKKFASQQTLFESTTTETPKISTVIDRYSINPRIFSRPGEQVEESEVSEEKDQKFVMRVIKRPFLPSRGGNPYKGRGLQPVGPASLDQTFDNHNEQFSATGSELSTLTNDNTQADKDQQSLVKSVNDQQQHQQLNPSEIHKTTLEDIYNEEYDVELNDALNPMLKPLTSSRGISGFSFSSLPIDEKDAFRSQSQKSIQKVAVPTTPATTTTTTSTEATQYEYEEVEYDYK